MSLLRTLFLPAVIIALSIHGLQAQNELEVMHQWRGYRDTPNALYNYLTEQSFEYLDKRKSEVDKIGSLSAWQQRQQWVRKTLYDLINRIPRGSASGVA